MSGDVEVDMDSQVSADGRFLGLFLYAEDADLRARLGASLYEAGGKFVIFPVGSTPVRIEGCVIVTDETMTVFAGDVHCVCPVDPSLDLSRATRAMLYILQEPFDAEDTTEKVLMAAT